MSIKSYLKKLIPKFVFGIYHKGLAILANIIYGFPSRKLIVIGVTGTNGKTTTCNLIWQIFTTAGFKTGLTTSINFKIGQKTWVNRTKQGMQGRFCLQKLLSKMVRNDCKYAVIETTSEGIKQYRHWGIAYDIAVFTNLTPEHIEAHGSFEKYKQAKGQLFKSLKFKSFIVSLFHCFIVSKREKIKQVSVVNLDDENADYFLKFDAEEKWGYFIESQILNLKSQNYILNLKSLIGYDLQLTATGSEFKIQIDNIEYKIKTQLLGQFNIYNCLAAIAAGLSQSIDIKIIQKAIDEMPPVPGRMEIIYDDKRKVTVIIDYAHDPAALENVYKTINELRINELTNYDLQKGDRKSIVKEQNLIAVLGAVGGGRDKAKRPLLGKLASQYAKYVIITNEDPYDDDPNEIINQVESGVQNDSQRQINQNYWKILDRREAIKKAFELAKPGDIIALTGKGCEEVMATADGFIPWDDRGVAREILRVYS